MTEFTEWRSLVDGERIAATPDSGLYPILQSLDRDAQIDAQLDKNFGSDS